MTQELVLFRGSICPYGARFRKTFVAHASTNPTLSHEDHILDEKDDAAWDRAGVRVSPTVILRGDGKELARLEARWLIGISRRRFERWLAASLRP